MAMASLALALAVSWALAEDLTIVSTVSSPSGSSSGTRTQYVSSSKIRLSSGDHDTILDLASGQVTLVNVKKREYSETSLDEMRAFMSQIDAAMAGNRLAERVGRLQAIQVTRGPGARRIAGYDTQQYVLTMGDSMRFEIWTAPALDTPVQYFDAHKVIYAAMGPMGRRFDSMFEEMKKVKGFPLATTMGYRLTMVQQQTLTEATEVRKGSIPAAAFEVPSTYRKVASPFTSRR